MTSLGVFGCKPKILLQKIIQNSNEILLCFLRNDPRLPYLMSSGSSRNDKVLLGEKSPSTYLGIIERGKRTQLDLGEITFGRVVSSDSSGGITGAVTWDNSSDSSGGITFNLYL